MKSKMTSTNRFRAFAQSAAIEDNKDILTLPEGAGDEPNVQVQEPAGNLQTDQSQVQFPQVEWNFFTESDPTTFNDDVTTLIEHLANLQVSMDVLEKAVELIRENQKPEEGQPEPQDENQDLSVGIAPTEPAPEHQEVQPQEPSGF